MESRDDAANYWRAENGLPVRAVRFLRALLGGSGLGRTAAVIVGASAVVLAGLVVTLAISGGDAPPGEGEPASSDPGATIPSTLTVASLTPPATPTLNGKQIEGTSLALTPTVTPIPMTSGGCPAGIDEVACDWARDIEARRARGGWSAVPLETVPFECPADGGPPIAVAPLCQGKSPGDIENDLSFGVKLWTYVDAATFPQEVERFAPDAKLASIGCPRASETAEMDCSSELALAYTSSSAMPLVVYAIRDGDAWAVTGALVGWSNNTEGSSSPGRTETTIPGTRSGSCPGHHRGRSAATSHVFLEEHGRNTDYISSAICISKHVTSA